MHTRTSTLQHPNLRPHTAGLRPAVITSTTAGLRPAFFSSQLTTHQEGLRPSPYVLICT